MATEGMLYRTDTLGAKVGIVEERCDTRKGHKALAEEIKDKVILHVDVPSTAATGIVRNDGLSAIVVREDRNR